MLKLDARKIYWSTSFLEGIIFSVVFAASPLYRIQTVGLNPFQLVLVGTVLELTTFVFEIPTGVIADVYSRRLSVIIGSFLFGIGILIETSLPVFGIVLLAQVIWGIAWTFISGAHSAWIADEVGVDHVGHVYLRAFQVRKLGNLLGIPLFVLLANHSYRLSMAVGGGLFLLVGLMRLLFMPETGFRPVSNGERNSLHAMQATFKNGLRLARGTPVLMTFAAITIFVGLCSEGYDRLGEAHFIQQFTFPELPWAGDPLVSWFAILRALVMILGLGTTEIVRRWVDISDNHKVSRALQTLYGLISLGLMVFAWSQSFYLAVLASLLVDTLRGMSMPLIDTWVNKHIESRVRATMLSMTAQLDAVGQVAGGPMVGALGHLLSIRTALTASAWLILPVVPLYGRTQSQVKENAQ